MMIVISDNIESFAFFELSSIFPDRNTQIDGKGSFASRNPLSL